ncbi:hypothetical protein Q7P37_007994 [Cladosporium fusiforme]
MEADPELVQTITDQVEEWSSNSNECFNISLVRGDNGNGSEHASFNPEFSYPIFGDEEAIFGYQDLAINLTFSAHDLRPRLNIEYGAKFQAIGDIKPTDVKEALKDFLPEEAFDATAEHEGAADWKPPGERIREYTRDGKKYEIWCASLVDDAAKEVLENMQILVPLFIEGGTTLQLEQDWTTQRWKLFLVYQVDDKPSKGISPYAFIGFGTSYRVFTFPGRKPDEAELEALRSSEATHTAVLQEAPLEKDLDDVLRENEIMSPLDLPSRERLSQFLILPTFQGSGHGQELYNTMYLHLTSPANVREFTVEDPNEAFDDMRDLCDMRHLRANNSDFASLKINTNVPAEKLKPTAHIPVDIIVNGDLTSKIRQQSKIDPRQFGRLVEMQTLSTIPPLNRSRNRITKRERSTNEHDKAYFFWRLYAKQRIYIFNRDPLMQLDLQERPEKVDGALDSVLEGYSSMLEAIEAKEKGGEAAVGGASSRRLARKRKVIDDEDDEWEDEEDDEDETMTNGSHKKARLG